MLAFSGRQVDTLLPYIEYEDLGAICEGREAWVAYWHVVERLSEYSEDE